MEGIDEETDYFGFPTEKAVIGSCSKSLLEEADLYSQWGWYATSSNRIKTLSGANCKWCLSSGYDSTTNVRCVYITTTGSSTYDNYYFISGLSPFGCI